jgi:predicted Zn finger-like uncharacterized protein
MIIQCRKCETRFRFDETQIEGEGFWVRCSRCRDVFFQERSAVGDPLSPPSAAQPEIPSVKISDAKRISEDRFSLGDEHPSLSERERTEIPPFPRRAVDKEISSENAKESIIKGFEEGLEKETLSDQPADWEDDIDNEEFLDAEPPRRRWGRVVLKILALLICAVLIAGGLYVWLFPEVRTKALEWASPWLKSVPGLQSVPGVDKILGSESKSSETAQAPIRLKDVRQRSVANLLGANLRVVEGTAVNQSPYFQSKIRVRLVISDANDAVLGERVVFCGNILTDAELNTLAESEIQRELSIPQGTDVINEKIAPNGEIPFMIVFSQEQAGAIKTVVVPAGSDNAQ